MFRWNSEICDWYQEIVRSSVFMPEAVRLALCVIRHRGSTKIRSKHQKMGYATTIVNVIRCTRLAYYNSVNQFHRLNSLSHSITTHRSFHACSRRCRPHKHPAARTLDPRLEEMGNVIRDEYAIIRDNYGQSPSIGRVRKLTMNQRHPSTQLSSLMDYSGLMNYVWLAHFFLGFSIGEELGRH